MPTINLGYKSKPDLTYNKIMYQKVYQDRRWRKLRAYKFKTNPLCELCELEGKTTQADEIHHIIPFEVNPDLAFDYDNLISVCVAHHKYLHSLLMRKRINHKRY